MTTQTQSVVFVLWNGGWDQYAVDPTQVREISEAELQTHEAGNSRYFPDFRADNGTEWIKGKFLSSRQNQNVVAITATQCVRALGHLAGGE